MDAADEELLDNFLANRQFLKTLISTSDLPEESQVNNLNFLFDFISSKMTIFMHLEGEYKDRLKQETDYVIGQSVLREKYYKCRLIKFLNIVTYKNLIEINRFESESTIQIRTQVNTLARFSLTFPFILKRLISDNQSVESAFAYSTINSKSVKIKELTVKTNQIQRLVSRLTKENSLIPDVEQKEFDIRMPYQVSEQYFEDSIEKLPENIKSMIDNLQNLIRNEIEAINNHEIPFIFDPNVDNTSNNQFGSALIQTVQTLLQHMNFSNISKQTQKLSSFLMRYIFKKLFLSGFDPYSSRIIVSMPDRTLKIKDMPIRDNLQKYDPEMLVSDFIKAEPDLLEAANELELIMFEISPIDVLLRVDKSIKFVQKFISEDIKKKTGSIPSFIPFDNVIQFFHAVFDFAQIHGIASIIYCVERFIQYNYLTQDLAYSYDTLIAVYSLRCSA